MSPELQTIFERRMQPTVMHKLLAAEWFNVEDAVEACIGDLDAGYIGSDDIKPYMLTRFHELVGLQKALVVGSATMRARACCFDLERLRDAA